jgi:cytochrome c-type biogenesis protein CcmH
MIAALFIFLALAALAAGFGALAFLKGEKAPPSRRQKGYAALLAAAVIAAGLGAYFATGSPELAARAIEGPASNDFRALVATLAQRMRERPGDAQGWTLLGRGYIALGAPDFAAKAFSRAIDISERAGTAPASLYALYGEALTQAAGQITPEAEAAFRKTLSVDARESTARYYLGLAARGRGDTKGALAHWQSLLADAPRDAPWREALAGEISALKAETQGAADVAAMVSGLAARLEKNPDDLAGWMRLVRSYAVLGKARKARETLARARTQFARDAAAQ